MKVASKFCFAATLIISLRVPIKNMSHQQNTWWFSIKRNNFYNFIVHQPPYDAKFGQTRSKKILLIYTAKNFHLKRICFSQRPLTMMNENYSFRSHHYDLMTTKVWFALKFIVNSRFCKSNPMTKIVRENENCILISF